MFKTPSISVVALPFVLGAVGFIASTPNEALAILLKLQLWVLVDGLKELLHRNAELVTMLHTYTLVNPRQQAFGAARHAANRQRYGLQGHDMTASPGRSGKGSPMADRSRRPRPAFGPAHSRRH